MSIALLYWSAAEPLGSIICFFLSARLSSSFSVFSRMISTCAKQSSKFVIENLKLKEKNGQNSALLKSYPDFEEDYLILALFDLLNIFELHFKLHDLYNIVKQLL